MLNKRFFRLALLVTVLISICAGCGNSGIKPPPTTSFVIGFDASEAKAAEDAGVEFKDIDGQKKPALQIFKDHGYSWVRIRIMVNPELKEDANYGLFQDLDYVKAMAQDAKKNGLRFLLNFHYSHWWADPGNQWTPPEWQGLDILELTKAVYDYTYDVITQLREADTMPDMVQIGNEVRGGMLWPLGKYWDEEGGGSWENFVALTNAAVKAIQEASKPSPAPLIMMHTHGGGDTEGTQWFFDTFKDHGGYFDVIGLSYYPMWHGSFDDLRGNIVNTKERYKKDVYIVEAAYYWDTNEKEYTGDLVPYPQTPDGQYSYLTDLRKIIEAAGAKGVFYWGSHWTQSSKWLKAPGWEDDDASRRSLFDDEAKATKGILGLTLK